MPNDFESAIEKVSPQDWLSMIVHAGCVMRKYHWRGQRASRNSQAILMVDGNSAEDFVQEAVTRIMQGKRQYNPSRTLVENINSITDSLIWSALKSSDRTPLKELPLIPDKEDFDPIEAALDPASEYCSIILAEQNQAQREQLNNLKSSLDGNAQLKQLLECLEEEITKPQDIAVLLDCTAQQASDLKSSFKKHTKDIFGVQNLDELKRKINEGGAKT